ncbi:MAG TPA: endonuclease V [Nocardioidaceae bacterium]|nr:endonuclease V [Nocardioidaceae bacterium]
MWPTEVDALEGEQRRLAQARPQPWRPPDTPMEVAGCWVCFPRGVSGRGSAGDPAWSAAAATRAGHLVGRHVREGVAAAPYLPGLMALRAGALLESVVLRLPQAPDVLLLDATGRDHPRRCGLTVHLGATLDLPTVGVTHRPLEATGDWPQDRAGATSPLRLDGEVVACWLRTRAGTRPLVVHPGWRTDVETSLTVVGQALAGRRTPEPLRHARRLARRARAGLDAGPDPRTVSR